MELKSFSLPLCVVVGWWGRPEDRACLRLAAAKGVLRLPDILEASITPQVYRLTVCTAQVRPYLRPVSG